jgi:hypothetical protein
MAYTGELEEKRGAVTVPLSSVCRLLSVKLFVFQTCSSTKHVVAVLFLLISIIFCCNTGIAFTRPAGSVQLNRHTF